MILCVCGLRSNDLPWELTEKVAVQSISYTAETMHIEASLKEIVIVTATSLHEDWLDRALPPLTKQETVPKAGQRESSEPDFPKGEQEKAWDFHDYQSPTLSQSAIHNPKDCSTREEGKRLANKEEGQ